MHDIEFYNSWSQVAVAIKSPSLLIVVTLRYDDNLVHIRGNLIQLLQQFSFLSQNYGVHIIGHCKLRMLTFCYRFQVYDRVLNVFNVIPNLDRIDTPKGKVNIFQYNLILSPLLDSLVSIYMN